MNVITRKRLSLYAATYPDARQSLLAWHRIVRTARWDSISSVRRSFPTADGVAARSKKIVTVFNIRGNNYRLITAIHYDRKRVFILRFMTHAEYDQLNWLENL